MKAVAEKKKQGRTITDVGLFKRGLIDHIESETPFKLTSSPNFWVETQVVRDKDIVVNRTYIIHCGGGDTMTNKIMMALETEEDYLSRIISFDSKTIQLSERRHNHNGEFNGLKALLDKFKNDISKYPNLFNATIETSFTFGAQFNPYQIKILFATEEQAEKFVSYSFDVLNTKKDGKILTIFVSHSEVKGLLLRKCILNEKNGHASLLCEHKEVEVVNHVNNHVSIPEVKNHTEVIVGPEKMKGLISSSLNDKPDEKKSSTYVHMSTDYGEFHLLPFNRKTNKRHVMELVDSMDKHGVLTFIVVVSTSCIDGKLKKWVVDGQNRLEALQLRKVPVLYTETAASTKKEIVRLIADLNKTSRRWVTKDFLNAWHSLQIEDYNILKSAIEGTKLPLTLLFEIFTGLDKKAATFLFQKGEFEIRDNAKSQKYIEYLIEIRKYIPRSRDILAAFVLFFNRTYNYDHKKMISSLSIYGRNIFSSGDSRETIFKKIKGVYEKNK